MLLVQTRLLAPITTQHIWAAVVARNSREAPLVSRQMWASCLLGRVEGGVSPAGQAATRPPPPGRFLWEVLAGLLEGRLAQMSRVVAVVVVAGAQVEGVPEERRFMELLAEVARLG